jgi:hypothetical protein
MLLCSSRVPTTRFMSGMRLIRTQSQGWGGEAVPPSQHNLIMNYPPTKTPTFINMCNKGQEMVVRGSPAYHCQPTVAVMRVNRVAVMRCCCCYRLPVSANSTLSNGRVFSSAFHSSTRLWSTTCVSSLSESILRHPSPRLLPSSPLPSTPRLMRYGPP